MARCTGRLQPPFLRWNLTSVKSSTSVSEEVRAKAVLSASSFNSGAGCPSRPMKNTGTLIGLRGAAIARDDADPSCAGAVDSDGLGGVERKAEGAVEDAARARLQERRKLLDLVQRFEHEVPRLEVGADGEAVLRPLAAQVPPL